MRKEEPDAKRRSIERVKHSRPRTDDDDEPTTVKRGRTCGNNRAAGAADGGLGGPPAPSE